jgi:hypothetical protein
MKKTTSTRLRSILAMAALAGAMAFTAAPALAQSGGSKKKVEVLNPPTPPLGKSDIPWTPYFVAVLLAGLIVGVNFIPSKRGHQD